MNSDAFYLELQAEATETLKEFGTQFTVYSSGSYSPSEGGEVAPGPTRSVTGIVADQEVAVGLINGTGISWHAKRSLILTADAAPQGGEFVVVDGRQFPMSLLKSIKPANITIIYMLDLTR